MSATQSSNQTSGNANTSRRVPNVPRVLVVDDESDLRDLIGITLLRMGLDYDGAASLTEARQLLSEYAYTLCLTDMKLPDGVGLELVTEIQQRSPELPVAVITAFGNAENAVAALKAGAYDYVSKPLAPDALRTLVQTGLKLNTDHPDHSAANLSDTLDPANVSATDAAAGSMAEPNVGAAGGMTVTPTRTSQTRSTIQAAATTQKQGLIEQLLQGRSPSIQTVRQTIAKLTRSMAPVAITGESGSGKELAARLIHEGSPRASQPFIAVNCGAIPENLMEAEFFGHKKGAFTGADVERDGFFQAADGGTLFLDEVADLPLAMQVKLLRAIQEKRVRKVGATQEQPVDVRIISATHQNLAQAVAQGRFRQDLFYRLNVIELRMPALRERLDDLPLLVNALIQRLMQRGATTHQQVTVSADALQVLATYTFPGNVRELENILERTLAFSSDGQILPEDLGLSDFAGHPNANFVATDEAANATVPLGAATPLDVALPEQLPTDLVAYLEEVERQILRRALAQTYDNRTAAAKLLGVSFRTLRYRIQRLGLK